jgi:hypothetical protein
MPASELTPRTRHVVVDSLGLLLTVIVTAASVHDRDGAFRLLALLRERCSTLPPGLVRRRLCRAPGDLGTPGAGPHRHHRQTQRRHHRIRRAAPPVGCGTDLRLVAALSPPGPRLRTTPRTPRSHGAVGHRRDHDPETSPHNLRRTTPSPRGTTPHRSIPARSTSSLTIYQQALTVSPPPGPSPGSRQRAAAGYGPAPEKANGQRTGNVLGLLPPCQVTGPVGHEFLNSRNWCPTVAFQQLEGPEQPSSVQSPEHG